MNTGMSELWETLILGWETFWACDCDLHNDPWMSLDFSNSMPYSPNSFFLTFLTYTHSVPRAMLSTERYKGEEEMISVLTPNGGGGGRRHVHQ